jgi:NADH-ubiquinone oxidoreductase chain 2
VVGLTQFRIKRLYAYSTISHIGFILLALSIHSIESIQSFIFYIIQYSLSNLNAFIILLSIGFSLFHYVNNNKDKLDLQDRNNSPIQLIKQLKGYFYINPILALSLSITLFSFIGIPPLIGFFAKQMVLSAALDQGYIFMALLAILTSVISAVYYLAVIKQIFFDKPNYKINPCLKNLKIWICLSDKSKNNTMFTKPFAFNDIVLSSYLTITVSLLTLIILLFIFIPQE